MELKVEDEWRLKLVSDCYQAQLLFEAWEGTWLHTYGASCQAGCHCGMRGDGMELHDSIKVVEDFNSESGWSCQHVIQNCCLIALLMPPYLLRAGTFFPEASALSTKASELCALKPRCAQQLTTWANLLRGNETLPRQSLRNEHDLKAARKMSKPKFSCWKPRFSSRRKITTISQH